MFPTVRRPLVGRKKKKKSPTMRRTATAVASRSEQLWSSNLIVRLRNHQGLALQKDSAPSAFGRLVGAGLKFGSWARRGCGVVIARETACDTPLESWELGEHGGSEFAAIRSLGAKLQPVKA